MVISPIDFEPRKRKGYLPRLLGYSESKKKIVSVYGFLHKKDWMAKNPSGEAKLYIMGELTDTQYFHNKIRRELIFKTWNNKFRYSKFPNSYIQLQYDSLNDSQKREMTVLRKEALLKK